MDIGICISFIRCHSVWKYYSWVWSMVSVLISCIFYFDFDFESKICNHFHVYECWLNCFCWCIFFDLLKRFNYRATAYMVERGFYQFLNWFDERAWYPLGRIVGGTVYPGLMITSGGIHWLLHALNIPVHIRDICVFLAPIFR